MRWGLLRKNHLLSSYLKNCVMIRSPLQLQEPKESTFRFRCITQRDCNSALPAPLQEHLHIVTAILASFHQNISNILSIHQNSEAAFTHNAACYCYHGNSTLQSPQQPTSLLLRVNNREYILFWIKIYWKFQTTLIILHQMWSLIHRWPGGSDSICLNITCKSY